MKLQKYPQELFNIIKKKLVNIHAIKIILIS